MNCRTCKHYSSSYGFRNGKFVGNYISCDLPKDIAKKCKKENFTKYIQK